MLPKVCLAKLYHICQKNIEFYLYIQVPNVTSKNVSWIHFSWPTLYATSSKFVNQYQSYRGNEFLRVTFTLTLGPYDLDNRKMRRCGVSKFCWSRNDLDLDLSKPKQFIYRLNYIVNRSLVKFRPLVCKITERTPDARKHSQTDNLKT